MLYECASRTTNLWRKFVVKNAICIYYVVLIIKENSIFYYKFLLQMKLVKNIVRALKFEMNTTRARVGLMTPTQLPTHLSKLWWKLNSVRNGFYSAITLVVKSLDGKVAWGWNVKFWSERAYSAGSLWVYSWRQGYFVECNCNWILEIQFQS